MNPIPSLSTLTVPELAEAIAARTPSPGGGAAAGVAVVMGCAAGAMAARYTTGAKWAQVAEQAEASAALLDRIRTHAASLAQADADAFAAAQAARAAKDEAATRAADARAAAVPAELLHIAAEAGGALQRFLPICNPRLRSDVVVGIHLVVAGGRAAWRTSLENAPDEHVRARGRAHLALLAEAERAALADGA
ncbi:MAG TPA: cyclodeaminase/cyclohydrolase family protein [Planctomycetota bacterium]|nr:cyclodeaminase/cyclohydrolase family protein [Planctomycetota bacterium]